MKKNWKLTQKNLIYTNREEMEDIFMDLLQQTSMYYFFYYLLFLP